MDYRIIETSDLPIPKRIYDNPIMKLNPGQALVVEVESVDEQAKLQNRLSAKTRTASRRTSYRYQTMKYETPTASGGRKLFVAITCREQKGNGNDQ